MTELLLQNIKTCCWMLSEEGISLRMTDNLQKILLDIKLESKIFRFINLNLLRRR